MEAGLPSPIDQSVAMVLTAVRRQAARNGARAEEAGKKHLTVEQLTKICRALGGGSSPQEVRDRALILLGFASALRRSDIARLRTGDVCFQQSSVRLWVAISKSDQEGDGRDVWIDVAKDPMLCPVRALEAWKALRLAYFGHFQGPLFLRCSPTAIQVEGLRESGICRALKRNLQRVGEDPRDYGAHSMRSGMITAADDAGASLRSIMDRTGHKKIDNVMRYIKSQRDSNPLEGVL